MRRSPDGTLVVTRRADVIRKQFEEETRELPSNPRVVVVDSSTAPAGSVPRRPGNEEVPRRLEGPGDGDQHFPLVIEVLRSIKGWGRVEAGERVAAALGKLAEAGKPDPTDEEVITMALYGTLEVGRKAMGKPRGSPAA